MAGNDIDLRPGEKLVFPVSHDHPLAPYQTIRALTDEDVLKHPFWSRILDRRLAILTGVRPAQLRETFLQQTLLQIGLKVGPIYVLQLNNINIAEGATLSVNGSWTELMAGAVTIGGTLQVSSPDPSLPPTLTLNCTSLGGA